MFSISFSVGFILLLLINLFLLFCISLYYSLKRHRRTHRKSGEPHIFRCVACGHIYLDYRKIPMAECEKCGNMNEAVKL